ncbi:MAG: redoxin domain-containing protein [Candidatus Jordarchaeaceae archaeon]
MFKKRGLFSNSADFTSICKTEFIAFPQIYDDLKKRNIEMLGLSVDSVSSHITWIRKIEEKMGVKTPLLIIADLNKEVAKKYVMIQPDQSKIKTVRCVFIIDLESKLRAIFYYPLTNGRNVQEYLKFIENL